ncbi:MAG: alginate export family protein [Bacteroidota bacterium]
MNSIFKIKYLGLIALGICCWMNSYAQFTLTGEVRPRTEFRNGFKTPTTPENQVAFFTEQRSRIYFDYAAEKYKFRLSLQDVRVWGEVPQIFKQEDGNTYLSEAWGQYFLTSKLSIKAGRQIISYDNQRILGGLEWAQQGRRHDALLLIFEDKEKKTKLHIGGALNSDDDVAEPAYIQSPSAGFYSVAGSYKNMAYAWFNKGSKLGNFSLLALNNGFQNPADSTVYYKQTLGGIASVKLGKKLTLGADAYYQTGKIRTSDVNALLAGVNLTLKTKLTPVKVGVEYISGKDDTDTDENTITNFSPDFGTNHAHNGFMDYFFVGPANGNVGVTDFYVKTKFKLKKGALVANAHEFLTGSVQLDEGGNELNRAMGMELDLVYVVKLAPAVTFNLGYSHLMASSTMLELRPGTATQNNWAWAMITFKPTLFASKKEK